MNTLTLKLPRALDAKLSSAAKKQGTTKSAIARAALIEHLNGTGAPGQAPSLAELAKDLIGCVEGGPRDLSYNKRHMKGFGK